MKTYEIFASTILLLSVCVFATDFGNPADMPPNGSVEVSADYSKHFIYTENTSIKCRFDSQRLLVRIGYVFYKWFQVSLFAGGADADLLKSYSNSTTSVMSNGSWELAPGVGFRIKPPLKFSTLGMRFHILMDGRYLFIRSRQPEITQGIWKTTGNIHLNEFDAVGLAVGYLRRFNLSFYAGIGTRYVWAEMPYTASGQVTIGSTTIILPERSGIDMLGTSPSAQGKFFPHMVFPLFGMNWNLSEDYTVSIETYLADMSEFTSMNPKIGFSMGVSSYK